MKRKDSFLPKYRFQEFSSGWEKIELGSISNKVTTKNRDESIKETLTNSAEFGIVSQRDFFDKDISNTANIGGYYIVEENDFVYNPRISNYAPFGPINRNNLGRKGIMSPLYHVFKTKGVNHDFLSSYFETTRWHKFMHIAGDKGARADRFAIGYKEFEKMPIYMPDLKEQTQIGNFFQQLDKLIELQTRAVESAETYKKAMLQKMFPQKGEKVPRVRFEGVSGDWDKMALGRTIKSEFKGRAQESLLFEGNTEYLDANRLNGGMPRLVSLEKNVEYEDILILWDGSKAGTVYKGFSGVLGSTLKCYKIAKNYNQEFIYQYVKSHEERIFQQYRTPNIPHVIRDFTDMFMVVVPCVEEQTKIGNFFQKLDQNIESEKKKLEQYQTMKRALLQRMFV